MLVASPAEATALSRYSREPNHATRSRRTTSVRDLYRTDVRLNHSLDSWVSADFPTVRSAKHYPIASERKDRASEHGAAID